MLFNSWTFAAFLALVFALYYLLPWRVGGLGQIGLLTAASYLFYAWHTPWLVVILLGSTAINLTVTLGLLQPAAFARRRRLVAFAVIANLAVLAFFKYVSLLAATFLPAGWWTHWGFDLRQIPLPIGISFFTFQGISMVVDVYRAGPEGIEGLRPPRDRREFWTLILRCAFFKAFFPQLVAGPIVKAHEFMYQIGRKTWGDIAWEDATRKLILGYFLKMVVADNLREATAGIRSFTHLPGSHLLTMLYGFSFQIFADFCGYSLIAMGLARLFGYRLPINFDFPYLSRSITEFWRRWHISLSTWLRQYLYIPLGGNRRGQVRTYFNLFVVMLLGGLWHGAAWRYMVWGGAHGFFLALERALGRAGSSGRRGWRAGIGLLQVLITFHLVTFLWLLFQLPDFDQVVGYLHELRAWSPGFVPQVLFMIGFFGFPVVAWHALAAARRCWPELAAPPLARHAAYAVLLFLIVVNSGTPGAFIYFQF